ncbi:MAG: hypothetical protein KC502_10325 [Myxococcales bacterium]|nr:hypothetical protein [Myxococcales bacterium]
MKRLVVCVLALALIGCNADEQPLLATGVDIFLPDGASLALDGVPTANQIRPTSPTAMAAEPRLANFARGAERPSHIQVRRHATAADGPTSPATAPRRYHLAWVRLSVPRPDGSVVVSESRRATSGQRYWAEANVQVIPADDSVPVP